MKPFVATAIALLAVASSSVAAGPDVTPAQCDRIIDVSVPYEVSATAEGLRFSGGDALIDVTSERIQVGDRVLRDASVQGYYDDLRGFLDNASSMANVAKSLFRRGAFPQAAIDMCHAILAVQQSGEAMQRRFPGFHTPVRVKLK